MGLSSAVGERPLVSGGRDPPTPDVRVAATLRPPGRGATTRSPCSRSTRATAGRPRTSPPVHTRTGALADDPADCAELWRALARSAAAGGEVAGDGCRLLARAGPAPPPASLGLDAAAVRAIGADQTNTTVVLGELAAEVLPPARGRRGARAHARPRPHRGRLRGRAGDARRGRARARARRRAAPAAPAAGLHPGHVGRFRAGRPRPARADRARRGGAGDGALGPGDGAHRRPAAPRARPGPAGDPGRPRRLARRRARARRGDRRARQAGGARAAARRR